MPKDITAVERGRYSFLNEKGVVAETGRFVCVVVLVCSVRVRVFVCFVSGVFTCVLLCSFVAVWKKSEKDGKLQLVCDSYTRDNTDKRVS